MWIKQWLISDGEWIKKEENYHEKNAIYVKQASSYTYVFQLNKFLWPQYANEILWLKCNCNCLEFDIYHKYNIASWKKNTNRSQKKIQTKNDYVQNVIISFLKSM